MGRTSTAASAAALLLSLGLSGHALAATGSDPTAGGVGVVLQGRAPAACSVVVTKPLGSTGQGVGNGARKRFNLGKLEESCNSGSGFDTFATTSPAQPGAVFIVDNADIPASAGGVTRIDGSTTAGSLVRNLAYETEEGPPQTMTFTIRVR
jgi:hypothetical protein